MSRMGKNLKILMEDPQALQKPLAERGAERLEYADKTHDYYALPGGQVTRFTAVVS